MLPQEISSRKKSDDTLKKSYINKCEQKEKNDEIKKSCSCFLRLVCEKRRCVVKKRKRKLFETCYLTISFYCFAGKHHVSVYDNALIQP